MVKPSKKDSKRDDVVARAHPRHGGRVSFVIDDALSRGYKKFAHVCPADVDVVLPRRLFKDHRSAGSVMAKSGELEILPDATNGVIPEVINFSNSRLRATLRDGHAPEMTRREGIDDWRGVVVSGSLAESIVVVLEAKELPLRANARFENEEVMKVAERLVDEYNRAFERGDGSATKEVWVNVANEMAAAALAVQAGLVTELPVVQNEESQTVDDLIEDDVITRVEVEN